MAVEESSAQCISVCMHLNTDMYLALHQSDASWHHLHHDKSPHSCTPAPTPLPPFTTHADMRPAVLSAVETTCVVLAALTQSLIYAAVITSLVTLLCVFLCLPFLFTAADPGWWASLAILCISVVLCTFSTVKVCTRWYRWLRARRSAASEPHPSPPSPPACAPPSPPPEASGAHPRCEQATGPPPPPSSPGSGAPTPPTAAASAETAVESLHEVEALPSLTPPTDSHSGGRSLAAVLVLPCNHIVLHPALSDMRSVVTTCPVCGGGVREAIRQAQT